MEIAPGTVIQSKYRLEKKLGEGSSSVVYKAQDVDLNKPYALKFLRKELSCLPSKRKFFLTEAKIIAGLRHPSIVSVRGIGEWQQTLYLVMDYYPDKSLKELMQERELSLEEVRDLSSQMLQGLKEAHRHGLVHGDIKPGNLMLKKEGSRWKLGIVDFGLAVYAPEKGTVGGTPFYMSPEQLLGSSGNKTSDLYSAAVCTYQMITGRFPIQAASPEELIYRILQEDPIPPSRFRKIPRLMDRVFANALSLEPESRYKDIQSFQDALDIAWNSRLVFSYKQLLVFFVSIICLISIFLSFHYYDQNKHIQNLLQESQLSLTQSQWGTSQRLAKEALLVIEKNRILFGLFSQKNADLLSEKAYSILWQICWKEYLVLLQTKQFDKVLSLIQDEIFLSPEGKTLYPYFLFYYEEHRIYQAWKENNLKKAIEIGSVKIGNPLHQEIREKQMNRFQIRKQIAPLEEWIKEKNFSKAKIYLERIRHLLPLDLAQKIEKTCEKEQFSHE
ncbi:MAG: serine/threonine protein kinase [Candidatus Brocadiae bacterium]|nr:serine/threonine protein kinase [Candidatus Brocadiia bacterium]